VIKNADLFFKIKEQNNNNNKNIVIEMKKLSNCTVICPIVAVIRQIYLTGVRPWQI
jgi:hypothetical protein